MKNNSIPQPKYFECSDIETAHSIKNNIGLPLVLKADGLAAGKGVIICSDEEEFLNGINVMFNDKKFGDACSKISIEECLVGEEVSVFAVCDGNDFLIIGNAQDHKRAFDGDMGPNTGGMGAYSPTNICDDELLSNVSNNIITPTLNGMSKLGHPYVGFLYIGLMIVDGLPYVIEFNVRMGDPETQVVIPRIQSSLLSLFDSCFESDLNNFKLDVNDRFHVTVVLASDGYPESYKQGQKILGIDNLDDGLLFHAGTKFINGEILVSGGRVLNMIGVGGSLNEAIDDVYEKIKNICYSGMTYRKDIGQKGLK